MQEVYSTKKEKETVKLAQKFASSLNGGEVVLLIGDLGAGKTFFTKEVIKALGYKGVVNSPTFTIMQQYLVKKFSLVHFDLYRLEDVSEGYNFGLADYIQNRDINTIVFIEWPDRAAKLLKGDFVIVNIEKTGEESRNFIISYEKV